MTKTQLLLLSVFILLTSGRADSSSAQVPELVKNKQFQRHAQMAADSLYNFNDKGVEQQIAPWKNKYPNDPIWFIFNGMKLWWKMISDKYDTSHNKHFIDLMKKADYAASKVLYQHHGNADGLVVRMAANGFLARLYSDQGEWMKSLKAAQKAYKAYGIMKTQLPQFPDLELTKGLKLFYSAYLPKAYPVLKAFSAFLPKGNEKEGLHYLREASKHAIFARAEATYFLGYINFKYLHNFQKATSYFSRLYHSYPRNNYYARLLVKSEYKMGHYNNALNAINRSLDRWNKNKLPYLKVLRESMLFWKGRIFYRNKKYKQALPLFEQSLQLSRQLPRSKHRQYYAESAYYAGVISDQEGHKTKARYYYKIVIHAKAAKNYQKKARKKLNQL
ncbi:MAG TPA: tetratricopeptide repeat protein [Balneolaceae bacterium]|nr:tetratricopeptide repeat protein [Balneolaceae bacterium]